VSLKDILQLVYYVLLTYIGIKILKSGTAKEKALQIKAKRLVNKRNKLKSKLALKRKN